VCEARHVPQASEAAGFDDARQWEQQVEDGVTRLGPQLPPSQLAGVLQHLGRLSWASSSGALLERLLPCLLQAAPQLSAPELAGSLWAAAKVGGPDLHATRRCPACQPACMYMCCGVSLHQVLPAVLQWPLLTHCLPRCCSWAPPSLAPAGLCFWRWWPAGRQT
jgi:hypothetical protein